MENAELLENDEELLTRSLDLQVVLLEFLPPDPQRQERFMLLCTYTWDGMDCVAEVQRMLQAPQDSLRFKEPNGGLFCSEGADVSVFGGGILT